MTERKDRLKKILVREFWNQMLWLELQLLLLGYTGIVSLDIIVALLHKYKYLTATLIKNSIDLDIYNFSLSDDLSYAVKLIEKYNILH